MRSRLARRLMLASVLAIPAFVTACPPPPWAFWRHERRDERHERRGDRHERHERH